MADPITVKSGSLAGLWVGEVVVNDVSESRLGGTNVASGALTIALGPRDGSSIRGAAELHETIAGNTSSVALTLTLALPSAKTTTPPQVISGTRPFIGGYAFVDTNQNGQRDPDEIGLGGVQVSLTSPSGAANPTTTAVDGAASRA